MLARFGSWYELFPRSWGGFRGVAKVLPQLARARLRRRLPAADPSDRRRRTARAATTRERAGPDDVGSPWAIGSADGGHDAIDPALGTWDDFDALVAAAKDAGVEIALDFAIQCSPDHPWLREHPEWFNRRPDGTLKYAENPPKRYQDIYNVNFDSEDWRGLWQALLDVVLVWVERGITVFRVDNPHTKPAAVLGVADPRGAHGAPGGDLPRRGVHAAVADDDPRQARVRAELHLLHLEEHEGRARGVHGASCSSWSTFYRPNVVREHARHPPRVPPARRPARVRGAARARRRRSRRRYGIYSGFESFENVPVGAGLGGVPRLGEVRGEARAARRPAAAARAAAERGAPRAAGAAAPRQPPLARDRERAADRLREGRRHLRRQPRSRSPSGRASASFRSRSGCRRRSRCATSCTATTFTWRAGRNYVKLGPGKATSSRQSA